MTQSSLCARAFRTVFIATFLSAFSTFSFSAFGQEATQEPDAPIADQTVEEPTLDDLVIQLKNDLREQADDLALPGFGISIVKNGEAVLTGGFGNADTSTESAYNVNTTQPIGSISKTFIAVAIMKAIELEYFDLETEINSILPFEVKNPHAPDQPILVKHLVTHSSGIVDRMDFYISCYKVSPDADMTSDVAKMIVNMGASQGERQPMAEMLKSYLSADGASFAPGNFLESAAGQQYEYSNIASSLAAYLIEVKAGISYSEFVRQNIFEPLEMNSTSFILKADDPRPEASVLYFSKEQSLPVYVNDSYPDGSVHTSVGDLNKFMLEMIRAWNGESGILNEESCRIMFEPLLAPETPGLNGSDQAVFWNVEGAQFGHDGSDPGVTTFMKINGEKRSGLIMMTNIDTDIAEDAEAINKSIGKVIGATMPLIRHE